jgi:hypothetical protein
MVTQFFQLKQHEHEVESAFNQGSSSSLHQECSSSIIATASSMTTSDARSACEFEAVFVPVKRAPGKRQATRVVTN